MPAFTPGLPASRTLCAMSSVRVSPLTSSSTGMYAVRPSLLIWEAPLWLKGSTALATCGSFFTREYEASIACLLSESVTFSPTGAWKTSGLLPFCRGGNWAASRLLAAWLSVPGRLRLSLVLAPIRCEAATRAATRTIQAPNTGHRWRAASRPTPCSTRATDADPTAIAPRRRPQRAGVHPGCDDVRADGDPHVPVHGWLTSGRRRPETARKPRGSRAGGSASVSARRRSRLGWTASPNGRTQSGTAAVGST